MRTLRHFACLAVSAAALSGIAGTALAQGAAASLDNPGLYVGIDYGRTHVSGNDHNDGAGMRLGYDFSRRWAAELSYANLGDFKGTRLNAWSLSALARLPLSESIDLFGRVGYARLAESGDKLLSRDGTKVDNGGIYGLGVRYALMTNLGAQIEWVRYTTDAHRWSAGLNYKF